MKTKSAIFVLSLPLVMFAVCRDAKAQELLSNLPKTALTAKVLPREFMGQFLFPSLHNGIVGPSCYFHLDMQTDGNLVTYQGVGTGSAWWATGTNRSVDFNPCSDSQDCMFAVLQPDGDFAIYDSDSGGLFWDTGTGGNKNDLLMQQDDGNLVVYSESGTALWWSRFGGSGSTSNCPMHDNVWTLVGNTQSSGTIIGSYDNISDAVLGDMPPSCGIMCSNYPGCVGFNYMIDDTGVSCTLLSSVESLFDAPTPKGTCVPNTPCGNPAAQGPFYMGNVTGWVTTSSPYPVNP